MIFCECTSCEYYDDGTCAADDITISDNDMTAAGFLPICQNYDEHPLEREDLGDYPDAIHNQFDNMTGSMNL